MPEKCQSMWGAPASCCTPTTTEWSNSTEVAALSSLAIPAASCSVIWALCTRAGAPPDTYVPAAFVRFAALWSASGLPPRGGGGRGRPFPADAVRRRCPPPRRRTCSWRRHRRASAWFGPQPVRRAPPKPFKPGSPSHCSGPPPPAPPGPLPCTPPGGPDPGDQLGSTPCPAQAIKGREGVAAA